GSVSRPVVQPLPTGDGQTLDAALARLARDPRNADALLDAGNAAMALGDVDAALGFLRRADEVSPGNGRIKAQIGKAMLRHNDPVAAIRAFDDAERAGADQAAMAGDRGLA
ncbi:tetratricopeptide repeat protein, partial [Novosphingobium sp. B-7]